MKLRQKLAVVLASAMVVTAVPVVTMASSTNTVTKLVTVSNESALGSAAPKLKVALKDGFTTTSQFYLTLENSKWDKYTADAEDGSYAKGDYIKTDVVINNAVVGTVTPTSDTEATVKIDKLAEGTVLNDEALYISLENVKVTGEAKISVDGNETEISSTTTPIVFANKSEADATVEAKDAKTFYTTSSAGEAVGKIVISEQVAKTFSSGDTTITIDLDHADYEFVRSELTIKGTKAFSSKASQAIAAADVDLSSDKQSITITLPNWASDSKGGFEISGFKVKSTDKNPEAGDLTFTVSAADKAKVETTTVKVATVASYGTILSVDNKDEVKAGKSTKVKLTYKEVTSDSVATSDVDFVLDKGYFVNLPSGAEPIYKDSKDPQPDELIGFTWTCTGTSSTDKFLDGKEFEIQTELGTEGDITITTSGRYVEEQSVVVAEVKPTVKAEAEAMTLKVGQSKQVGGKLVLTEEETGALNKHSVITLKLAEEDGISFTELPEVTVSGNGKATVNWVKGTSQGQIQIDLTKGTSTEACTVTIEGFEVKVDRTVPQGSYDLKVKIDKYEGTLKAKDFFVVGTPNAEELAANGLPKGTATFTIGSANYTVNGKVATMDASAYIQDPGYTMVPVRYVATAFGVNAQDILFSNGTATIFAGSRTIQLTAGSDVAIVNGASVKLSTKVVVKDGRTYAPVGEIARILGISANWDSANKVATFENK